MIFRRMFTKSWILATLFVLAGSALCVRLGIWQLDRLKQRRAFNSQVITMRAMPVLDLNAYTGADVTGMEWRPVTVTGVYDLENQVALRNQYNTTDEYGYHLITPLKLADGRAVLVDRGWIPADGNAGPADWHKYDVTGTVTLKGQIRLGQDKPRIGGVADPAFSAEVPRLDLWNNLNVVRIGQQSPYPLLTIYVQPDADPNVTAPPIPFQPEVDLTEGPHQGYAIQWFTFASILFFGYPFFLRKQAA